MNSTIINQRSRRNIAIPLLVAILASLTITRNRTTGKQLHTSIETRKSTFDPTYRYAPTANFTENELFVKSYANLWQTRFESSEARNKSGGYVFFKHMRKAGGTAVREYLSQVFAYHNNSRSCDALLQEDLDDEQFEFYIMERNQSWFKNFGIAKRKEAGPRNRRNSYKVHYVEQEFLPMDWNCPTSDPRWEDSLSIIVLRHPIERHMSEFFYKGPGGDRENGFKLDKQKLYTDEDYSKQLSEFIFKYLPPWMAKKGAGPHRKRDNDFKWFFIGEVYMDNFQLRSLAGCSSGECMKRYHIRKGKLERMEEGFRAATGFYTEPISACTNFFDVMCKPHLDKRLCRNRVDGPCFYPAVAWGDMSEEDLARGIKALEAFDVVLLMEKLNDKDQSSFFADVMGVHHDVTFSFNKMSSDAMNSQVGKESPREVTHFYRDILSRFELLRDVQNLLYEENRLEIALFERAVELNRLMIDRWKTETKWGVSV